MGVDRYKYLRTIDSSKVLDHMKNTEPLIQSVLNNTVFLGNNMTLTMYMKEFEYHSRTSEATELFVPNKRIIYEIMLKGLPISSMVLRAGSLTQAMRKSVTSNLIVIHESLSLKEKNLLTNLMKSNKISRLASRNLNINVQKSDRIVDFSEGSSLNLLVLSTLITICYLLIKRLFQSIIGDTNKDVVKLTKIFNGTELPMNTRNVNGYSSLFNSVGDVFQEIKEVAKKTNFRMCDGKLNTKSESHKWALYHTEFRASSFIDEAEFLRKDLSAMIKYERRFGIVISKKKTESVNVFYRKNYTNDFNSSGDIHWIKKSIKAYIAQLNHDKSWVKKLLSKKKNFTTT
jgi:hypothetical protein